MYGDAKKTHVAVVLNLRILSDISINHAPFDHKSRMAQEKRSVTLLTSIVILFFVCHTGGLVYRFVDQSSEVGPIRVEIVGATQEYCQFLFNINSFANPMLYFFFTRQFRDLRVNLRHGHFSPASRSGSLPNFQSQKEKPGILSVPILYRIARHPDSRSSNDDVIAIVF